MKYRVEWRPMKGEAPTLTLCQRYADAFSARLGALAVATSQEVNEFAIATLTPEGCASARVLTNVAAIANWDAAAQVLPAAFLGDWSAHLVAADAGAVAFAELERALRLAWLSGAAGRSETARLIREARRLLDDNEEEDR